MSEYEKKARHLLAEAVKASMAQLSESVGASVRQGVRVGQFTAALTSECAGRDFALALVDKSAADAAPVAAAPPDA